MPKEEKNWEDVIVQMYDGVISDVADEVFDDMIPRIDEFADDLSGEERGMAADGFLHCQEWAEKMLGREVSRAEIGDIKRALNQQLGLRMESSFAEAIERAAGQIRRSIKI